MSDTTAPTPAAAEPAVPRASRLGWRAEQRPRPGFAHALGATAGAFLVVALVAFVVAATDNDPTTPGVLFSLLLIAAALLAGARAPGPLRSACTTVLVLTVPVLWLFAFAGGGSFGRGEYRAVLLLTTGSYLVLYLLGWTRGRGVFLAGTLLLLASWLAFEVAGSGGGQVAPFGTGISSSNGTLGSSSSSSPFSLTGNGDNADAVTAVTMLLGFAYLAFGAAFDVRRWAGLATPFVAVGAYESISGAVLLGAQDSTLTAGLLAIAAGLIVGLVASRGVGRRATTWIGALTVLGGMIALIVDIAPDSASGVGGIATGFAAVLGAAALLLAPRLGEPVDGAPEAGIPVSPAPD
jgi:hypothetical protein